MILALTMADTASYVDLYSKKISPLGLEKSLLNSEVSYVIK